MDRLEFCNILAVAKENSGKTTSEISFAMKMLLPTLRRFEKGEHNFNVKKVMEYLNVINNQLVLISATNKDVCRTYDEIVLWIKNTREGEFSQRKLAEAIQSSHITIANIERQISIISIDVFLKIVQVLGYEIKIEKP